MPTALKDQIVWVKYISIFICYQNNAEGKEIESQKKVAFKGITFTQTGEFTMPVTSVRQGSIHAELIGENGQWNELKVHVDKKVLLFQP